MCVHRLSLRLWCFTIAEAVTEWRYKSDFLSCPSDGEGRGNPMVSAFQDELDPDDTEPSLPQPKSLPLRKDVALTSDEEAPPVTQDQDLDSEPELKA